MRIDQIETFTAVNWMMVRITTDDGVSGVGESTFFGWPGASENVVRSFESYLVGQDPLRTEHHWNTMYRSKSMRGGAIGGALSAIDQALWDIKGKHFGAPVWQLLGGKVRDAVRAMLVLPTGTLDEVANHALQAKRDGFTAVKCLLYQHEHAPMRHSERIQDLVDRMAAVRESVGWDMDIGVEIHRNMIPGEAIVLAQEIERLRPYFYEDPVAPDSILSFGEVSEKTRIPMAAGERNLTIWEFREYAEAAGVHHLRPDIGVAGGFTHCKKICAIAESRHQGIIPHAVPSGPVATAAHVQLGAVVPNFEVQEHVYEDAPPYTDVVKQVVELRDGWLQIPDAPGIGIEIVEEGIAKHPHSFGPVEGALRDDGSVALR